jgi:hypothetical protein
VSDQAHPEQTRQPDPEPEPERTEGHAPGEGARRAGPHYPDPAIPYVHGRALIPIRMQPRKYDNPIHSALFEREDKIRRRIRDLDKQVLDLSAERRELLQCIKDIHDELRPRFDGARGRRRRAVSHEEALPPAADDAVHLIGRALRATAIALLRQAGRALTLRELHIVLHRLGYLIAHEHPVKALADALGHEADAGRAIRVERATYRAAAPPPEPPTARPSEPPTDTGDDGGGRRGTEGRGAGGAGPSRGGDTGDSDGDSDGDGDGDAPGNSGGSSNPSSGDGDAPGNTGPSGGYDALPDW